tara:strand:- start:1776 stop:2441 length:666 start_codon:yes stop_codon:yes gene_type:complete
MKRIKEVFSYHVEIAHEGDRWVVREAVRHLNDAKRTTQVVDLKSENSLRSLLELDDNNCVAPEDMSGISVKEFLDNDFWAGYRVLDATKGKEVVEVSIEWTETKNKTYRDVDLDTKWSLWSSSEEYFQEIDKNVLELMKSAFDGTGESICLHLASSKEIRFGKVWIEQNEMTYEFRSEFDESYELTPDNIAFVSGTIITDSFSNALLQVEKAEEGLIAMEK